MNLELPERYPPLSKIGRTIRIAPNFQNMDLQFLKAPVPLGITLIILGSLWAFE